MNTKKWTTLVVGCVLIGMVATMFVRAAVSTIAGLAVANGTTWTNLKDASFGDGATNGVALVSPALWNGSSFVRAIGDATNGMKVNVVGFAGTTTPSDAFANPTTAILDFSLPASWNGTAWDRYTQNWPVATSCNAVTSTGACTTLNHSLMPKVSHTWTIVVTGAPTSVSINLEGSLDNTSFFTMDNSVTTTSQMKSVVNMGVDYIRCNLVTLTGGVSPTVTCKIQDLGNN